MTTDGGSWTYTWDGENRLARAVNGSTVIDYKYDYGWRRVEKKVTEGGTVTKQERFVYDEYLQIERLNVLDSNIIEKKRIWGLNENVVADVSLSGTFYAIGDGNKNITEYVDASGVIQGHYEFSPFGKLTVVSGSNPDIFDFRFSSECFDTETGLIYFNFRYYSPELGRWMNRDPIEELGGFNLYNFCNSDPINFFDLLGLAGDSEYCRNLRSRMKMIMGALKTEAEMQRQAAEASRSLNNWQWGRAIGDIASGGYGGYSALKSAGKVATSVLSSTQKAGATSVLRNVKNAETGLSMVDEIATQSSRAAYMTTATVEIAVDQIQDKLIEKGAGSLVSDDSLSRKSAGDMIFDSIAGGDETQKDLMNMAEKSGKNFDNLNRYYNGLRQLYKKCCE